METLWKTAYYDGKYAVCLTKRGKLVGFATFNVDEGIYGVEKILNVIQIQGNKGTNINNPNWRRALIFEVEELAIELGVSKVTIGSARNNRWPKIQSAPNPGQRGYLAYDQTAIDSQYAKNSSTGDYEKRIRYDIVLAK